MYVKKLSELKKALKSNQPSIKVKDKKFRAIIIKSAIKKGRLYSFDDQKINGNAHLPGMLPAIIAEITNTTLSVTNIIGLLPVFALYRKYKTKVVINKDGTLSIENEDFPERNSIEDKY